jgi:hypothetical protein
VAEVKAVARVAGRAGRMAVESMATAGLVEATVAAAAEGEIEMGELGAELTELTAEESEGWRSGAFTIQPPPALGWRQGRGQAVTTTWAGCECRTAW